MESVCRQTGVEFELLVVDDGSEDNTAKIVERFDDPRIRLVRNQGNKGIGYCCVFRSKLNDSTFIAHVDSDNVVLPGACTNDSDNSSE